jgi:hypothetical protein
MSETVAQKRRAKVQNDIILKMFSERKEDGITNTELKRISNNYTARMSELAKKGYVIDCESLGNGVYKYVLVKEPSSETTYERAIDLFWSVFEEKYDGIADREVLENIFEEQGLNIVRKWGRTKEVARTL